MDCLSRALSRRYCWYWNWAYCGGAAAAPDSPHSLRENWSAFPPPVPPPGYTAFPAAPGRGSPAGWPPDRPSSAFSSTSRPCQSRSAVGSSASKAALGPSRAWAMRRRVLSPPERPPPWLSKGPGGMGPGRPPRRVHLGNIAHRPIPLHLARRFQFPGQYPQQGGLSRTIGPHQAHPLPLGQGERLKSSTSRPPRLRRIFRALQDHFRH